MVDAGRDAAQIAERFGKSPSWVSNRKRLTTLPVYVQEHVHEGDISVRQGMALATAFAVEEEHPALVERVSVDLKPGTMVTRAVDGEATSDDVRDWTRELTDVVERVEEEQSNSLQDLPCAFCGVEAGKLCTTRDSDTTDTHRAREKALTAKKAGVLEYGEVSAERLRSLIEPASTQVDYDSDEYSLADLVAAHQILRGYETGSARSGHKARARKLRKEMGRRVDVDGEVSLDAEEVVYTAPKELRDRLADVRTMDLKAAIDQASEKTPDSDRPELPEEWQWDEGCPEASVHGDDGGYQATRKWRTVKDNTVRSRVSAGQKEKVIERAHKHENNLCRDYFRRWLAGKAKPSLPDGWVWEVTRFVDGVPQIGAFRYKGEPTCPAGWSASADGEDVNDKAQEAIRIEEKEFTDEDITQSDDPDRDCAEASAGDGGSDASTRPQEDLRSDDQNGPERASSEDSASRPSVDEEEREESKGAASRIVLVACSKSKLNTPAHAQALYKGQLFEKSKAYAKQLVEDGEMDAWYILSAKHGLVEPQEMIDPYDETLADASAEEKREWGKQVILQLKDVAPTIYTPVAHLVLGGKDYYEPIRSFWEDVHEVRRRTFMAPFEGMVGNGEMMQWLDERLEKEDLAASDAEMSGDGAPSSDSSTDHPAHLPMVIDAVEADGHDWQLKTLGQGSYEAMVQVNGTSQIKIAEGATPAGALQSAWHSAQDVPADQIGSVNESDVDRLLSADGTEMWDDQAAEEASIASLLVAHRVAGQRQETWRTTLIAEAVEERAGRVTSDDVPDDVLEEVQAEVERRLEPVEA
jgi:hypothetical protein